MTDRPIPETRTIPDHVATRVARLINEAEDMRQQAADDLKQIYADLREELRGMGWTGPVVSAEVAALKGAIADMRLDDKDRQRREAKDDRIGAYVLLLNLAGARAHTREGGQPAETGEITDNQESGGDPLACRPTAGPAPVESASDAISTPAGDQGPLTPATHSHSQETPPPADTAGGDPLASSATHSSVSSQDRTSEAGADLRAASRLSPDDEPFEPPAFLHRDYSDPGPIPEWMDRRGKTEAVEA